MRAAPPVSVGGNGGLGWRLLQAALPALALGVACVWGLLQAELGVGPALPVAAVVGLLAWRASAAPAARLVWDGQCWAADGVPGRIHVMMDLGFWLLLRLQPDASPGTDRGSGNVVRPRARRRWIAISAAEAGPALHGLRAALYAQQPAAAGDAAPPVGQPR